jgi:hypothetical protein
MAKLGPGDVIWVGLENTTGGQRACLKINFSFSPGFSPGEARRRAEESVSKVKARLENAVRKGGLPPLAF